MTHLDRADFLTHLTSELVASGTPREFNNIDRARFDHSAKTVFKEKVLGLASSLGFYRAAVISHEHLRDILKTDGLDEVYGLFQDQLSRDLFVRLLAYRILGHRHVRLPLNNEKYWQVRRSVDKYAENRGTVTGVPILGSLDLFNFNGIRLHAHPLNILNTFLLEQYRCARGGIGVRRDDVVIDAGGCWGDTALYFAYEVGETGQVYSVEFINSNLKIMEKNLQLNNALRKRIKIVERPLWSKPDVALYFKDRGPSSRGALEVANGDEESVRHTTTTIDAMVEQNQLSKVDFIKMDVESAEPEALRGAEKTIRQFRPKLAISVYHSVSDFVDVFEFVSSLNLGYKFYLGHYTMHWHETVLFAVSDGVSREF